MEQVDKYAVQSEIEKEHAVIVQLVEPPTLKEHTIRRNVAQRIEAPETTFIGVQCVRGKSEPSSSGSSL